MAKVITAENRTELLPRFFDRSKGEAAEIVAELRPRENPPRRTVVTAFQPGAGALHAETPGQPALPATPPAPSDLTRAAGWLENLGDANSRPTPQESALEVEPLTAELRRFHVTVSKRFLEKLAAARDALSHSMPRASEEEILEAGLDLVLAQHAKKQGNVSQPRREPRTCSSDHVPAHVKRAAWARDGGKCSWPMPGGGVCGSTYQLEYDHLRARALGGKATIENIAVRCRFHNLSNARETFGDELMDLFTRIRGSRTVCANRSRRTSVTSRVTVRSGDGS